MNQLLVRLHRRKDELLKVLERPESPLHTNASENHLCARVTKRRISGGTMSADGRQARDVMLGLMKTFRKLGISFFATSVIGSVSKGSPAVSCFFRRLSRFGPPEPSCPEICPTYPER